MSSIDLHLHTNASDGSLSPTELVRQARQAGLLVIAITDHDSTKGLAEATREGERQGVVVVPGIELSIEMNPGAFHLLGYGVTWTDELCGTLQTIIEGRKKRNRLILDKLAAKGFPISYEELLEAAGEATPGRPHIAKLMVEKGYVADYQEVFDNYLKKGALAYQQRFRLSAKEGIGLLKRAGAIPVMAHPFSTKLDEKELEEYLVQLKALGLMGLEVYYTKHSEEQTASYLEMAEKLGLLVTGGSDFHGASKPRISMGTGYGNLDVPAVLYEKLKSAMALCMKPEKT